jgi:hypothetical protein
MLRLPVAPAVQRRPHRPAWRKSFPRAAGIRSVRVAVPEAGRRGVGGALRRPVPGAPEEIRGEDIPRRLALACTAAARLGAVVAYTRRLFRAVFVDDARASGRRDWGPTPSRSASIATGSSRRCATRPLGTLSGQRRRRRSAAALSGCRRSSPAIAGTGATIVSCSSGATCSRCPQGPGAPTRLASKTVSGASRACRLARADASTQHPAAPSASCHPRARLLSLQ